MSELPSYSEMAAEKLKERSKASGGELGTFCLIPMATWKPETFFGYRFYSRFKMVVVIRGARIKKSWP